MSKSLGNVVEPRALAAQYGVDQVRYFFLREMVFGLDAHFSDEALIGRINSDLANDLGNLLARSLGMAFKYRQGVVPAPGSPQRPGSGSGPRGRQWPRTFSASSRPWSSPGPWPASGSSSATSTATSSPRPPGNWPNSPRPPRRLDTVLYHLLEVPALDRRAAPAGDARSALKMSEQLGLGLALWDQPLPQVLTVGPPRPRQPAGKRPGPVSPDRRRQTSNISGEGSQGPTAPAPFPRPHPPTPIRFWQKYELVIAFLALSCNISQFKVQKSFSIFYKFLLS